MTHLTLENKNTEARNTGSCEKEKIRQWQRKNEIHPLAFYETFHMSDYYSDGDSVSESYSDTDFDSDSYDNERLIKDDLMEIEEPLHIQSRPLILYRDNQISGLIKEIPNAKNESKLNSICKALSTGNVFSKKISVNNLHNDKKPQQRIKDIHIDNFKKSYILDHNSS